ncbi:MAG TPA: trigger factor [Caulobacterales bacterium]|nr:trigger factor [Caulobacterales bacterium]
MECSTTSEGLTRVFHIKIPAADLQRQLDAKIAEVGPKIQIKGFRPGKVPPAHIRKVYGQEIFKDIINEEIQKTTQEAIKTADVRILTEPHHHLESDIEKVREGKADLAFFFHVDVMPDFEPIDAASISLERLTTPVSDAQVEEALAELAKQNRPLEETDAPAGEGDALTIDFLGKIDGVPFEGGAAENAPLMLGSNQFIPGFEEQLFGAKTGDERVLNVTFPENYGAENLAGKAAAFEVKVKSVRTPKEAPIDDAFAERFGMKSLGEVKDALRKRLESEHAAQSRAKLKRGLFDILDKKHAFDLPKSMVEGEFRGIWEQIQADKAAGRLDPEDEGKTDEALEKEYRTIAERRVRLGLVLAEIGRRNNVQVPEDEVAAEIGRQARQFPGQERQVVEFYQKNPQAMAQIRAPIYEERVVDFILELAKTTSKEVAREELFAEEPGPAA